MIRSLLSAGLLVALSGCSVSLTKSESTDIVKNQCTQDSDCGEGECFLNSVCVAHQGALPNLLIELSPPVSTPPPLSEIGGLRFLQMESGLGRSNEQHDLDLELVSVVHGYIKSSCAFDVTVTPQEQSYGLPAASLVTHTTSVATPSGGVDASTASVCGDRLTLSGPTEEFVVDVPPGAYDVYVRPSRDTSGVAAPCNAVPQLYRGIVAESGVSCYPLPARQVQTLDLRIPWSLAFPSLDGWTIDILHPITGQVLSRASEPLHGLPTVLDGGYFYSQPVSYSPLVADDAAKPGQELLRLSPPSPGDGPVVQLSVGGLVVGTLPPVTAGLQTRVLPPIGPFPSKVHVDAWVWAQQDFDQNLERPVPSTVGFTATRLDTVSGIFASFSTTAVVGADGHLSVDLLPGDYRVRVVPEIAPLNGRHLGAQEVMWSVRSAQDGAGSDQAGRVVLVQNAAIISGRAVSAFGKNIAGAAVQALAASTGTRRCDGADGAVCAAQPVGVLEMSLAQSVFVPRTAAGVTGGDGTFDLSDVDCGGCTAGTGASFDLTVQPADGTRLPWLLRPGVSVQKGIDLGTLAATLPVVQRGKVEVPLKGMEPTLVPGTLIRAYVIRDASGAPIFDPTGLPNCSSGTYSGAEDPARCISSTLQVAETHADSEGTYELVLPSSLGATAP